MDVARRRGWVSSLDGPAGPASVRALCLAKLIGFGLQSVDGIAGGSLDTTLGLVPTLVTQRFFLWQLATYVFLHSGVVHLCLNLLALWTFGGDLEGAWGPRRFLAYYATTAIGAGAVATLVDPSDPSVIQGASGALYGVLVAHAMTYPSRSVLLYGLLPVRARTLAVIFGGLAFLFSYPGAGRTGVAHVAHLGGLLVGIVYLGGLRFLGTIRRIAAERVPRAAAGSALPPTQYRSFPSTGRVARDSWFRGDGGPRRYRA
jgi:membrane associated rhomboid family serine protease